MKTLKAIINFLLGLLAVAKWLPFLGKYKEILLVASTVLSTIAGVLTKCENTKTATPEPTKTAQSTPQATPVHTPSLPTPTPPEIVLDRIPHAGNPFTVRYTAPFAYNTHLWADKWRLQILGRDPKTGNMIAPAVVLRSAGKRVLTVRDDKGNVLASKTIEVKDAK